MNDTAQDRPISKPATDAYRDNWEAIFEKKEKREEYLKETKEIFHWHLINDDKGGLE